MSGSGSVPVSTTGAHSGTVGPGSLGPGPGPGIGILSGGLGSSNVGVGAGMGTGTGAGGTIPPLGLDFVKVRVLCVFRLLLFASVGAYIFNSWHFSLSLLHFFSLAQILT